MTSENPSTPKAVAPSVATPLPPTDPKLSPNSKKRRRALLIVATAVIIVAVAWLLYHFLIGRWNETTDDAYVQGDVVSVTSQIPGTVTRIALDDGMKVEAGQPVVNLDVEDAQLAFRQAEAALGSAVRQVRGLHAAANAASVDIRAREIALAQATADVARRRGLVASGAVSAEELAHAESALASAQAALAASRDNAARSRAPIDASSIRDNPQVAAAAAQLRQAYLSMQRASIVAPVSGFVAKRTVQLGQRIAPGTPLMAIIPLDGVWVDANFKETQLKNLRLGQGVELTSELYGDDVVFHGKLASLGMGTGSAFSILPAQNASGNWIKIVQRVPVRVQLDPKELQAHPLRLGLTMSVKVNLHDKGNGLLPTTTSTQAHATTSAYDSVMARADEEIERVVRDNMGSR